MTNNSILIVDDNPLNVKLERFLLAGEGFDVRTAADSEECLSMLKEFEPDLILMDIQLPGMDGLSLTRQLKGDPATRDIVILALTAYAMNGDDERARAAGCDGYITKPIDTRTLVSTVRQYLDGAVTEAQTPLPPGYQDVLAETRSHFLLQNEELCLALLNDLEHGVDVERLLRVCHGWAGAAGTLGFVEITQKTRQVERRLQYPSETPYSLAELRSNLMELLNMFSDSVRGNRERPPLPESVTDALRGKQFGLLGFSGSEERRIATTLCEAGATAQIFADISSNPDLENIDAVIMSAYEEVSNDSVADLGRRKPVLLIGSSESLARRRSSPLPAGIDFLFSPWDTDEVLVRAHRILAAAPKNQRSDAAKTEAKPKILIADDNLHVLELLRSTLESMGLECHTATDGQTALTRVKELSPDAVILDVKMPELDGFGVVMALKRDESTQNIRIVMLTGRDGEGDVVRGFGLGVDDYVTKPFKPMELAARLVRLLPKTWPDKLEWRAKKHRSRSRDAMKDKFQAAEPVGTIQ